MKVAFFSAFPLECGGGLEKYFIEFSLILKNNFNENIDKVGIINLKNNFYEKFCRLLSLSLFYKIKPCYRETTESIKSQLQCIEWEKTDFKNLRAILDQYDVIYTKNEILELAILRFAKLKKNIKIIAGVHTPPYYPLANSIYSKLHNFLYKSFIYKILAKNVNRFHVINRFSEKLIKTQFPNKDVALVYNPFNFSEFRSKANLYRYNFKFEGDKYNIIWAGRLTEQKGVSDLIDIVDKINRDSSIREKIVWNIAGDGDQYKEIEKLRNRWENINYFGHVDQKYMADIFSQNNLFICTSHWEGFPYIILEAQSCFLPVVAFDIDGLNDIIDNSKNGFLVKNINEFIKIVINFIMGDSHLEEKNIYSYIENKFNYNKIYQNLFELLMK